MKRFLILGLLGAAACTAAPDEGTSNSSEITDVSPTSAKEQSVPNCWLYAMASWAEAMHRGVAGEEVDLSESYWTYWHWFDQLTTRELAYSPVSQPLVLDPTGHWPVAAEIIARRGWMLESDFIPERGDALRSQRQWTAIRRIQATLRPGGPLDTPEKRTPAMVLAYLDQAFEISPAMSAKLRATFGADGKQTFNDTAHAAEGIRLPSELSMRPDPSGQALTLADTIGASPTPAAGHSIIEYPRLGTWAWQLRGTNNGWDDAALGWNHGLIKEVQKTLHSHRPVYLFWAMDDTHRDASGAFEATRDPHFTQDAPVKHLSVITDYEVDNVPGFGLLPAGVGETRPEALAAALDDRATIRFFRIKNPWWGTYEANGTLGAFAQSKTGYNDITLDYLNGSAFNWRRIRQVVLPPDIVNPPPPTP